MNHLFKSLVITINRLLLAGFNYSSIISIHHLNIQIEDNKAKNNSNLNAINLLINFIKLDNKKIIDTC